jgi:hypothetical protein
MTTLPRSFTLRFVTQTRKHSQGTQHFATMWLSLAVTTDGHDDLRTSQKAEFPPCTMYLTVRTDGHDDLRTSQKAEFLSRTLYPYREN